MPPVRITHSCPNEMNAVAAISTVSELRLKLDRNRDVVRLGVHGQHDDGQGQHAGRGVVAADGPAQPGLWQCSLSAAPLAGPPAWLRRRVEVSMACAMASSVTWLAAEFGHHLAGGEDHDPVAEPFQLPGIGGHDDHAGACVGGLAQDAVDLGPGADVDALGRLLGEQQRGPLVEQRPGQQHLLLVAAGQAEHVGVDGRRLDGQVLALRFDGAGLGSLAALRPSG